MLTDVRCIWCQKERSVWSVEHPIPEALGNTEITLDVGVCRPCNNKRLAGLDRALLKPFELLTVSLGIPRKGGRKPTIDGWRGMRSRWRDGQPELFLNAGPGDVTTPMGVLKPAKTGILDLKMPDHPIVGEKSTVSIKHELRFDRKFVRAIYKCGFELFIFQTNLDIAQAQAFDKVRLFCLEDEGHISGLAIFREHDLRGVSTYYMEPERPETSACSFELFGIEFVCDFSAEQTYLDTVERELAVAGGPTCHRIPYC